MWFWDDYKPTRPHQWDGSLADVRAARFDGMAAYAEPQFVAKAGALAGVLVTILLRILPLSPIRRSNFLPALVFFALYGGFLGLWRRRGILAGNYRRLLNRDFLPHTLFSYVFIPFLPILYMFFLPELSGTVSSSVDTFAGGGILLLVLFWAGAFFDYLWEGFHNFSLVHLSRRNPDRIGKHTLHMWIRREEKEHLFRLDSVKYSGGQAVVHGWFEDPADLRRKMLLLDFVNEARVEQEGEKPA